MAKSELYEPFDSPTDRTYRFNNEYRGAMAERMELNRTAVEKFCAILDPEGDVYLLSGRVDSIKDKNVFHKATPSRRGWIIEVDDNKLIKVAENAPSKSAEDIFISGVNTSVKKALSEVSRREWVTNDVHRRTKFALGSTLYAIAGPLLILGDNIKDAPTAISTVSLITFFTIMEFGVLNSVDWINRSFNDNLSFFSTRRFPESEMDIAKNILRPPLPLDNVIASKSFLKFRGNTIIRPASLDLDNNR